MVRHVQSTQNNKFAISLEYHKKEVKDEVDILHENKHQRCLYKLILSFLLVAFRLAQITQNNKFAVSFQYLKKDVRGEIDYLLANKHQNFLQVTTFVFGECENNQGSSNNVILFLSIDYEKVM